MIKNKRYSILKVLFVLFISTIPAAVNSQGRLEGKVLDSATGKPLALATIAVYDAKDTTLVSYRMSAATGEYKIPNLPLNKQLRMLISFSGYSIFRSEFTLTETQPVIRLDSIRMGRTIHQLEDVLVYAERPPVIVKKDTIEFNAASFKTLPSALVEDLLKKLPGVQMGADGSITVNGRKVNRILVDGRDFFGGDTRTATSNLPANIVDKVQVMNDGDELEMNPDISKAALGQVINLRLKKNIKKGWFGKAYAGAGNHSRHEAGSILNLFRDTLQVSVIGFINNLSRPGFGFADIRKLGGFERSGVNSISNNNGGLTVNGISFGGTGEGIQTSGGAGFNLNNVFKKNITLNTQYFYGQLHNTVEELVNVRQYIRDTVLNTRTTANETSDANNHRVAFSLRGKTKSNARYDFKPGIVFSKTKRTRNSVITASNNFTGLLNKTTNDEQFSSNEMGYAHTFSFNKPSKKKKGANFSIHQVLNSNAASEDRFNHLVSIYTSPDTSEIDQLRNREPNSFIANTTFTCLTPLKKSFRLRIVYGLNYAYVNDDLVTYERNNGKYNLLNQALTNSVSRKTIQNKLTGNLAWINKALTLGGSLNLLRLDMNTSFQYAVQKNKQQYQYILPGINLDWKELNMEYSISLTPPGIYDVQPVPDNTTPLNILKGNPDLKPALNHNVYLNYFKNIFEKSLYFSVYLNGSFSKDAIVRSRQVNASGLQITQPVNIDGVNSFFHQAFFNKQHKLNPKWNLNYGLGYYARYTRSFLLINAIKSRTNTIDFSPELKGGLNWNDKIEWNIATGRSIYNTYYQQSNISTLHVRRYTLNTDIVIRWPKNIVWEASLDYRNNPGTVTGAPDDVALLNAGINFVFMKDNKGRLKLSFFDILNQNLSIRRYTTDNYVYERQLAVLNRYLLLNFTYDIRSFKTTKVGGRQGLFLF